MQVWKRSPPGPVTPKAAHLSPCMARPRDTLVRVLTPLLGAMLCALAISPARAAERPAGDAAYRYRTLYVDGSVSTSPSGINEDGTIVGSYQLERGADLLVRPFSYKDGVYTLYAAGEPASFSFDDINDANHGVSNVGHRDFTTEAFFVAGAARTPLAVPGAISTQAYGLNDKDVVVGSYLHDPDRLGIATTSAFAWSAPHGYERFDVPGAAGLTIAWGMNRAGTAVGVYIDADGVYHGFIRTRGGHVTTVDHPGSPYTQLMGINARGDVVGFYQDPADFNLKGFIYRGGRFLPVAPDGALNGSYPYRITDDGRIVGYYLDANYRSIGFLATPKTPR